MVTCVCRQRGLLQGRATLRGAEQVRNALKQMHTSYQDLQYNVNLAAEEVRVHMLHFSKRDTSLLTEIEHGKLSQIAAMIITQPKPP